MNPKIKEILDNSGIETDQDGAGYEYYRAWPEDMEKFAELIVLEICNVLDIAQADKSEDWVCADDTRIIDQVKDHFGVE